MVASYLAKGIRKLVGAAARPGIGQYDRGSLGRVPSTKMLRRIPWLDKLRKTDPTKAVRQARHILTTSNTVRGAMRALDDLLETYGVEVIYDRNDRGVAEYLNTGDTYTTTILFDHKANNFRVMSWGDWVESYERRHAKLP